MASPGPPPARWMDCPRKGELLMNKFIPFKTPLSHKFDPQVPEANRFPPKMLFTALKSRKLKLGLWINLTYTDRYYDAAEVESMDCKYMKLQCRGHGETPSPDQTKMFVDLVSRFSRKNPLECIGVHCTHGFNRTGFLLIAYMVEDMDCSLEFALQEFSKIRPPGIYKQDYINELFSRYGEIECSIMAPMLPSWHTGSDDTLESEPSSGSKVKRNRNVANKSSVLMPEISSVLLFTTEPRASQIVKTIQLMCGVKDNKFPGSQPVSMDRNNIVKLQQKPYRVSWKADGTRFLMLIDGPNEVYLFDRDNCPFHVKNLRFPRSSNGDDHITRTLLDGEMVIDKEGDKSIPRFLCYDIVVFEDLPIGEQPFYPDRMNCIRCEIIAPRYRAMEKGLIDKATEPFSVRIKEFYDLTATQHLLSKDFTKTLLHEPDGLIFQPSEDPYMPLTCEDVLKWKPLSMNSVDFKLKIVKENKVGMLSQKIGELWVGQLDVPFTKMKYDKALRDLDNKIIECKYQNNEWIFMRQRTDKSFPNSYNTAKNVVASIVNPVTEEILMNMINHHRYTDDSLRMPPPGGRASNSQSDDYYKNNSELLLMPEIRNVHLVTNEQKASNIIKLINHICEFHDSGYPGCQPVTMTMDNINKLNQKSYHATWKGDGMKMLLLIEGPGDIFLLDTNNQLYQARNLKFPRKNDPEKHIKRTLLEGEMVIDIENDRRFPRFFCYDIILYQGSRIRDLPFYPDRINCIKSEILSPRLQGVDKSIEPFSIRLQRFYNIASIQELLNVNMVRSLNHEATAIFFQPIKEPYMSGMTEDVLRWKPPKLYTAVFRLKITTEQDYGSEKTKVGELYVKQSDIPFATIPYTKDMKELDNKIIECLFDEFKWIFVRQRPDRSSASSYDTVSAIVEVVDDPVSEEALVDYILNHRFIEDSERMPPPKRQKF